MLSTIQSQKVILTEEEKTYFAKTSEEEIANIKKCHDHMRNNTNKLSCGGTTVEQYKDLQERQKLTYWPTYNDPEKDTLARIGHRQFAEAMSHIINKNATIIDIGGGTGYLAAAVKRCGFLNIDCMEPVQNMIDMQPKGLYGKVHMDTISSSQPCKIETGTYGCAMMFGVVNTGHLEVEDFPELLRVIKPGGFVVFTLADFWCKYKDFGIRLDTYLQENLEKKILESISKERVAYAFRIEDATLYVVKKSQNSKISS